MSGLKFYCILSVLIGLIAFPTLRAHAQSEKHRKLKQDQENVTEITVGTPALSLSKRN